MLKKLSSFLGKLVVQCELCKLSHQSRRALARARRAFKNLKVSAGRFMAAQAGLERGVLEQERAWLVLYELPRNGVPAVRKANDSLVSLEREFDVAQRHTAIQFQHCLAAISVAALKARDVRRLADECLSTAPDFRTLRFKAAVGRASENADAACKELADMAAAASSLEPLPSIIDQLKAQGAAQARGAQGRKPGCNESGTTAPAGR